MKKRKIYRSSVAVAFDEIFATEIGADIDEFERKIAEKMSAMMKIMDHDRLWSGALVHDRIIKAILVSTARNIFCFQPKYIVMFAYN